MRLVEASRQWCSAGRRQRTFQRHEFVTRRRSPSHLGAALSAQFCSDPAKLIAQCQRMTFACCATIRRMLKQNPQVRLKGRNMANNRTIAGQADHLRINLNEDWEVCYWTEKWNISREQLAAASTRSRRDGKGRGEKAWRGKLNSRLATCPAVERWS